MICLSWIYILKKQTKRYSESHKELAFFGYFPGNEGKYTRVKGEAPSKKKKYGPRRKAKESMVGWRAKHLLQ
jgi:hypothetical protein